MYCRLRRGGLRNPLRIFFPTTSLTLRQTGHAGWCYRQRNVHHGVSRHVHTCHTSSVWTCSHLWRERRANGGPAGSGFLSQMPVEVHAAGLWAQVPLQDITPLWSLFLTVWSETCTPVTCRRSFCRDLAVLLLFLLAQRSRYRSCCWFNAHLHPCPCLLAVPTCSSHCAGRHGKPSCNGTHRCAILQQLDYLCNLTGLQVLPHDTNSDKNTRRNQSGRIRREQLSVATTCKIIPLAFASPLHLLSLSLAPWQVKLIHYHLWFLNGQLDIPWVQLTWCYNVAIKCSLHVCECI